MMLDGEWRVAFIKAEHPELEYGTAPMPVDDAKPSSTASGYINGTIIGIPKSGKNQDEAWELVKYLTTNDHALAEFSNGIRNVPSTRRSTKSKELKPDANFATFLEDLRQHAARRRSRSRAVGADYLRRCSRTSSPSGRPAR